MLSDRGLGPALEALAGRAPVPVELAEPPAERLPPAVESASYFVVAEALTNVARYAGASHAEVSVNRVNGQVEVAIRDDGVGGADPGGSSGLRGLADRVAALDGRLEVEQPARRRDDDPGGDPVRVVVADDSVLLREGGCAAARRRRDRGRRAGRRRQRAGAKGPRAQPDVAIVDVRMPPTNTGDGLRAAQRIRTERTSRSRQSDSRPSFASVIEGQDKPVLDVGVELRELS